MTAPRTYGVRLIRGPFVTLTPHPDSRSDLRDLLDSAKLPPRPLAVDLFCGAGGLSLGLQAAGFHIVLGVDNDPVALETHRSHFPGLTLERDLSDPRAVREVSSVLRRLKPDLIAGGPPCQPYSRAGRSKIRSLIVTGQRSAHDRRRDLWKSFLEIVETARPRAALLENVPDMALGDDMLVLRSMTASLEDLGYAVHSRLLDAWRYGIPQHRQRLIVVALADRLGFTWPEPTEEPVTIRDAIGDLPAVEGGWRPAEGAEGFLDYPDDATTAFQNEARRHSHGRVYDHITRPVRPDDRRAFNQMDSTTSYADLDPELKRYRDDIFVDKYRRLGWPELSRTITAHVARDGYWYIHPDQPRTLTVREAARLQTFPDHVRFAGPPTAAFRQVGNAVPPRLAEVVGRQIKEALAQPSPGSTNFRLLGERLIVWWYGLAHPARPWLMQGRVLTGVLGEMLLNRLPTRTAFPVWQDHLSQLIAPGDALCHPELLHQAAQAAGRTKRLDAMTAAVEWMQQHPRDLEHSGGLRNIPGLTSASAALVTLAALDENPVVVTSAALRVATRFFGTDPAKNRQSEGRMAIARLVGGGRGANATHLALIELGTTTCRPATPDCEHCPLRDDCSYANTINPEPSALLQ